MREFVALNTVKIFHFINIHDRPIRGTSQLKRTKIQLPVVVQNSKKSSWFDTQPRNIDEDDDDEAEDDDEDDDDTNRKL